MSNKMTTTYKLSSNRALLWGGVLLAASHPSSSFSPSSHAFVFSSHSHPTFSHCAAVERTVFAPGGVSSYVGRGISRGGVSRVVSRGDGVIRGVVRGNGGRGVGRGPLLSSIQPYDELMQRLPSKSVLEAVEQANGKSIVASDLAARAGISLSQARKDLTALASLTRGDIAVSSDGELLYSFPPNLSATLSSNSAKYRFLSLWREKVFPPLFYATKVGFGIALLASLVAIYSTIFFVLTSGGSSDRDDDRRDRREGGMPMLGGNVFWGPSPFDFFYYRPYYSRYYYLPGQKPPSEMGFLESVFSYVFGDGNPNGDLEQRRLGLAADLIRANGGAVSAEQLAPFCDDAPMPNLQDAERAYVDETFVLPIVTQLDGEPQVTDDGDIVYVFPELMTSASSSSPSSSSSYSKTMIKTQKEARILERAGLDPDTPAGVIKSVLNMNGISTRGVLERSDLISILEDILPATTNDDDDDDADSDPSLLQEREYKFSLATNFQTILAGILGVVNLGGALYLGNLLGQYALYGVRLPSYMGTVQTLFPFLLTYAVLFNAIPLFRNFWINKQNDQIRQRNRVRQSWRKLLQTNVGTVVKRKLIAASKMGKRMKQLGSKNNKNDIVFDTKQNVKELEQVKERDAMKDFDKLLERKDDSAWE